MFSLNMFYILVNFYFLRINSLQLNVLSDCYSDNLTIEDILTSSIKKIYMLLQL